MSQTHWIAVTALASVVAIVLSQLPPMRLWFKSRRLLVDFPNRVAISHKAGNPNVGLFLTIRNTSPREVHIDRMQVIVHKDAVEVASLPALSYFVSHDNDKVNLLRPLVLSPGQSWQHGTNFFNPFERGIEREFRQSLSNLKRDLDSQLEVNGGRAAGLRAPDPLVQPFKKIFDRLFVWDPGEYKLSLEITTRPQRSTFRQVLRFTLFESDSKELRDQVEGYPKGDGLFYNSDAQQPLFIPLEGESPT